MPKETQQPESSLRFRLCERPNGSMAVWFQYCDWPEVGPLELTADEAAELGVQVEQATRLLLVASERSTPSVRRARTATTASHSAVPKLRLVCKSK